jgi:hypothetical protein
MSRVLTGWASVAVIAVLCLLTSGRLNAAPTPKGAGATATGYKVTVTVTDAAGKPVAGDHVELVVPNAKTPSGRGARAGAKTTPTAGEPTTKPKGAGKEPPAEPPIAQGVTDATGTLTFENIPNGSYSAEVTATEPAGGRKGGAAGAKGSGADTKAAPEAGGKPGARNGAAKPGATKTGPVLGTALVSVSGTDVAVAIELKPATKAPATKTPKKGAAGAEKSSPTNTPTDSDSTPTPTATDTPATQPAN